MIEMAIKRHLLKHNKCIVFTNIRKEAVDKLLETGDGLIVDMKSDGDFDEDAVLDVSTLH